MDEILKYFPDLTPVQREQFAAIGPLYKEWNEKINVISRKDIDNIYEHHILHSLAIAKFVTPAQGTKILDMGTGGGFPGIPLAIMWPQCHFHLIDRIGKKIKVATAIAESVGLENVTFQHGDMGECHSRFDYVVSRAVMKLDELVKIVKRNISPSTANRLPAGLLCLKGKDLVDELGAVRHPIIEVPLQDYFSEEFFSSKSLIYVEL
jgi:16S rRNA methyltransferase gidB